MQKVDVAQLRKVNAQRLSLARITRVSQADEAARAAVHYRGVYEDAVRGTSTPWWWVAAIDYREESFNHNDYLGNGQPLSRRTTEVPAGRGPFSTWQAGAADALKAVSLSVVGYPAVSWSDWSLAGAATAAELWNGPGYAEMGRPSPYVWAGTSIYTGGLYTSDGHYDASRADPRVGVVAIWQAMQLQGVNLGFPAVAPNTSRAGTATPAVPSPPAPAGVAGHSAALLGGVGAAILGAVHYLQNNGEYVMFDILCVVGAVALAYLAYWLYHKLAPTVTSDVAVVKADAAKVEAAVKPAAGATGA